MDQSKEQDDIYVAFANKLKSENTYSNKMQTHVASQKNQSDTYFGHNVLNLIKDIKESLNCEGHIIRTMKRHKVQPC